MAPDLMFRAMVEKLELVVTSPSEIELLLLAAPLRNLILDSSSVTNRVRQLRKERGLPNPAPHFEVARIPEHVRGGAPAFFAPMDGLSPRFSPFEDLPPIRLNTGQFRKAEVAHIRGETVTVTELIRHVGYVGGVLHAGPATSQLQEALLELDSSLQFLDSGAVSRMMRGVADVVAHGLRPLVIDL